MKEISKLFDILNRYEEKYPKQTVALGCKRDQKWVTFSPAQYKELTDNISYGLMKLGVEPGDKVGIIANNRPEWNMLDMGIMQIGAITVPVYPTISESDYHYIVNHSDMKVVFVEGVEVMNKISNIMGDTPKLEKVYTFINRDRFPYLDQLIEMGRENANPEELKRRSDAVKEEDCCTIMYTSGTTGHPKGVMLSHRNIVHQLLNLRQTPAKWSNKAFSFLPICHAYERMLVFLYQYLGMSVYYAQNLGTIAENIKEVNPTMMSAVPRVLEKFYDKIWSSKFNMKPMAQKIFVWAVGVAKQYKIQDYERSAWYNFKHRIADKLVYKKIREKIGGNFDIVVSGAASIQPHLASFFSAIGMPVFEGYGSTETSPVIAVSCRDRDGREVGTVGFPLPGVEIKFDDNGELLCRGHNVMMGYYKDPELTAEVIDKDGWYHTGDMGRRNEKGQIFITGRIKSLFKTSFGKYINPEALEEKFCESPFIANMMVVGENQKFAGAVIAPDFEFLKGWCERHEMKFTTPDDMVHNPDIIKRYNREIQSYNKNFGDFEQIKKFILVPDEWTIKNEILTPTLKVKRRFVHERYANRIDEMFK